MKIGILGTRGIPNAYGGFEQFAEYLAQGLQERGHEVYVYNSSNHPYKENTWNNIHLIHCKDREDKLGTPGQFFYDYNCLMDARKRHFDILLQLGYTSNSVWYPLWPKGNTINVVNMDGLEWKRTKYGRLTKQFLKRAERWAARHGDILISDSPAIRDYILQKYRKDSVYIPYGAIIPENYNETVLGKWNLPAGQYLLAIARMEPENNLEMIIKGYLASQKKYPLILVGNTGNKFGSYLVKTYSQENIRFVGAIYDQESVNNLRHYAALYFHGHSVGGTNPSLLEAMACRCNIAAHDNVFNKAVLTDGADYFSGEEDVARIIDNHVISRDRQEKNLGKIKTLYNWQNIINEYETVFLNARKNAK